MTLKKSFGIILVIIIILTILGCANEPADIPNQHAINSDYQYYLHKTGRGLGITETVDGYYMINGS